MRAAIVFLTGLALLLLSCGGGSSPADPPQERSQPERVVYFRQSPAPRAIVAVNADGSKEEQLFAIGDGPGAGVTAADCSPDGAAIAFAVAAYDQSGDYVNTLMASNLDGSDGVELSKGLEATQPAWSPDGQSIAFVWRNAWEELNELWLVDADGSNPHLLASGSGTQPRWSPDGSRIAFTSMRDGNSEIYTVSVVGGDLMNLTRSAADETFYDWSADGELMLFRSSESGSLRLMDTGSGDTESISISTPEELGGVGFGPISPRLSHDGALLAFTAAVPSGPSADRVSISAARANNATVGVFVTNADGTATHRVDSAESAVFLTWCR